jgi:hypothetical protein
MTMASARMARIIAKALARRNSNRSEDQQHEVADTRSMTLTIDLLRRPAPFVEYGRSHPALS